MHAALRAQPAEWHAVECVQKSLAKAAEKLPAFLQNYKKQVVGKKQRVAL